jgi:NADH-quinone oxidoreductase subunit L
MVDPNHLLSGYALLASLLLPLAGVLVVFFVGGFRTPPEKAPLRWPGLFVVTLTACSLLCSIVAGLATRHSGVVRIGGGEWIPGFGAAFSLQLDWLSSWLLMLLEIIGLMVVVYSIGYMREECDQRRFFGGLLFFVAAMKLLLVAGSYLLLFAGWEGVGLASFLLVGFYFQRPQAAHAATKAFVVNRIGDAGFVLALSAMGLFCGSTNYDVVTASASHWSHSEVVFVASLLTVGAVGKSAQFPLHVWLPDAMEGPTPVSALIHSATMVCAGVYLLARSNFLYVMAPEVGLGVATTGAITALFAASVALVENDIKRVLAYSTISQLGFMFVALGLNAHRAAMYHVVTHAFFKSLLFLCAGSVIHALHGEQNLKHMGGLRRDLPFTFIAMTIGALTLAGVPGFSAFFSKDLILAAGRNSGHTVFTVIGLLTSAITAVYSWRLISLAFFGTARSHRLAAHEGARTMRVPLFVLAACCVLVTFFVKIQWSEWPLMLISASAATLGIGLAWYFYLGNPVARDVFDRSLAPIANFLRNRWYVDAVFEEHVVEGVVLRTAAGANAADALLIDGAVRGTVLGTRGVGTALSWSDTSVVDRLVRLMAGAVRFFSWPLRAAQGGFVQTYGLVLVAGVLAALGYYLSR